ncbi:hypothetical protein [Nonomuraea basaltis]|uniref:hypothetical protein n=1 Tax=Nonomuraea basaltis TaxID=2495887 RepID=UPI00110C40B9|nr:hypothetical protein [Nonomuraea basaltis]TMR99594.1 hypothetical protein EJK15_07205 [Nonomuraea basaltis]
MGVTSGEALNTAKDQNERVGWLMKSTIISAKIATGDWSKAAMKAAKGKSFATHDQPPTIRPINEIVADPKTFDDFMEWAQRHTDVESTTNNLQNTMGTTAILTVPGNLNIGRY